MDIEYNLSYTKIYNSYKLQDSEIPGIVKEIIKTREERGLPVTRSESSYIKEIKSHNRLYRLGIQRSRTRDTDLEEGQDLLHKIGYGILGI